MNIFKRIFHSHQWQMVNNQTYFIISKDEEMLIGERIGEMKVIGFICSVCNAEQEIHYDKITYGEPKKIDE